MQTLQTVVSSICFEMMNWASDTCLDDSLCSIWRCHEVRPASRIPRCWKSQRWCWQAPASRTPPPLKTGNQHLPHILFHTMTVPLSQYLLDFKLVDNGICSTYTMLDNAIWELSNLLQPGMCCKCKFHFESNFGCCTITSFQLTSMTKYSNSESKHNNQHSIKLWLNIHTAVLGHPSLLRFKSKQETQWEGLPNIYRVFFFTGTPPKSI